VALGCGSQSTHIVHLIERLHKVEILNAAALALHSTAVVAVVFERRRHLLAGGGVVVKDRLMALFALESRGAARRCSKHII